MNVKILYLLIYVQMIFKALVHPQFNNIDKLNAVYMQNDVYMANDKVIVSCDLRIILVYNNDNFMYFDYCNCVYSPCNWCVFMSSSKTTVWHSVCYAACTYFYRFANSSLGPLVCICNLFCNISFAHHCRSNVQ